MFRCRIEKSIRSTIAVSIKVAARSPAGIDFLSCGKARADIARIANAILVRVCLVCIGYVDAIIRILGHRVVIAIRETGIGE